MQDADVVRPRRTVLFKQQVASVPTLRHLADHMTPKQKRIKESDATNSVLASDKSDKSSPIRIEIRSLSATAAKNSAMLAITLHRTSARDRFLAIMNRHHSTPFSTAVCHVATEQRAVAHTSTNSPTNLWASIESAFRGKLAPVHSAFIA